MGAMEEGKFREKEIHNFSFPYERNLYSIGQLPFSAARGKCVWDSTVLLKKKRFNRSRQWRILYIAHREDERMTR